MSETNEERLNRINEQHTFANRLTSGGNSEAGMRIIEDLFGEGETDWVIEQAGMFQNLAGHHDAVLEENKRLREALAFYADAHKWSQQHIENDRWTVPGIMHDKGIVAAKALEEK